MDALQLALERENIPLELYAGCEVFSTEETPLLLRRKQLISLNYGSYLLVEFDFGEDVSFVSYILEAILDEGYIPPHRSPGAVSLCGPRPGADL